MMDVEQILAEMPDDVQRELLEQKIQMWRNTVADTQLDAAVAKTLGDDRMKAEAAKRMKQALKAVTFLEKRLAELPEPEAEA